MKTIVTLILIFTSIQIYCQESFIDYIEKKELKKEIDYKVIASHFQIDTLWKRNMGTRYYFDSKKLDKDNNLNILILKEENGVGSIAYLYSFTNKGDIIDNHKIMEVFDNADLLGPDYDFFYTIKGDLVILEHRLSIPIQPSVDNPGATHITENYKTYINLSNHGFFFELTEMNPPKDKRLFEFASNELMPIAYLERLTADDLLIMRNEIYASHGYQFKSDRLKAYFNNLDWYVGNSDNVDNKLGAAERDNIKLIKLVEGN
jgi:hypothetical protein